jgi:hypothetical protein
MKKPDWQSTFRNLPEIPIHKMWKKGSQTTLEQDIVFNYLEKRTISKENEQIFKELTNFYIELNKELKILDYATFNTTDFENFKNYITYAFNYNVLISNDLTIQRTYRLVVNEWVTGKNERIKNIDFLKYPSLEIVKKANKYNRANTQNTSIFYTTECIDTALKEIEPPKNKLVTVGMWIPNKKKKFTSYPITHSEDAIKANIGVAKATQAFDKIAEYNSKIIMDFLRHYFVLLGSEFTKPVNNHLEYYISALFSERILQKPTEPNNDFKFECIIYPSVGNKFETDNLAILPDVIDNDFALAKVYEFEIEESYYENEILKKNNPEKITLAKIKNGFVTKKIIDNKIIDW